jgi:hypothetical protein
MYLSILCLKFNTDIHNCIDFKFKVQWVLLELVTTNLAFGNRENRVECRTRHRRIWMETRGTVANTEDAIHQTQQDTVKGHEYKAPATRNAKREINALTSSATNCRALTRCTNRSPLFQKIISIL